MDAQTSMQALIGIEAELGAHNYNPLNVVLTRGEGVWVWDSDGNRYLDCLAAYSAVNQGHCHPRIREALIEQAGRLSLTSRAFRNDQMIAVEFHPEVGGARRFCETLKDAGILCEETHKNTIRFAPPLVIDRDQVDFALQTVEKVLRAG